MSTSSRNKTKSNGAITSSPQLAAFVEQLLLALQSIVGGLVNDSVFNGLTRVLLIGRVRLHAAIEQAVDYYSYACEDHAEAEACLQLAERSVGGKGKAEIREKVVELVRELVSRFGRHRQYWREVLNEFDVAIDCVAVGEVYDPERHTQIGTQAAEGTEDRNRIAAVERQRFTWTDEFGLQQSLPARVIVFD